MVFLTLITNLSHYYGNLSTKRSHFQAIGITTIQTMYVTMMHVRLTIVAVEKQYVLNILSLCL